MTTKHTPGLWSLVPDPEGWTLESNGLTVTTFDATEANARLIAAAPDMLAALRVVVDSYSDAGCEDCGVIGAEAHQAVLAAIAKATSDA